MLLAPLPSMAFARHPERIVFPIATARPDPALTPGATSPAVTQSNIDATICRPRWTRTVRPPEGYTERLKRAQIRTYGYRDRRLRDYEEDHLIPPELWGAPASPQNLWHVIAARTVNALETSRRLRHGFPMCARRGGGDRSKSLSVAVSATQDCAIAN